MCFSWALRLRMLCTFELDSCACTARKQLVELAKTLKGVNVGGASDEHGYVGRASPHRAVSGEGSAGSWQGSNRPPTCYSSSCCKSEVLLAA
jgi:hypothetical protein